MLTLGQETSTSPHTGTVVSAVCSTLSTVCMSPTRSCLVHGRAALFTQYSEAAMRSIGVPIADNRAVTQSRWEASYDGLHYASTTSGDNWASQVASMEYQVVMNVIFPKCGALPQP